MFKKILSVVTIILVIIIGYTTFSDKVIINGHEETMFQATLEAIKELNICGLLLLIP